MASVDGGFSVSSQTAVQYLLKKHVDDPRAFRMGIDQLKAARDEWNRHIVEIASMHARLGETEEAFQYLERAYAMRGEGMAALRADVRFDSVRGDPRFADLLRRIGLPPLK